MPTIHGRTSTEEAFVLLEEAEQAMREARILVSGARPTKQARSQAFRLLSRVEARCAVLKIALDVD